MKRIVTGLALSLLALPHAANAKGAAESVPLYGRTLSFIAARRHGPRERSRITARTG
jgi:hypothetical protein